MEEADAFLLACEQPNWAQVKNSRRLVATCDPSWLAATCDPNVSMFSKLLSRCLHLCICHTLSHLGVEQEPVFQLYFKVFERVYS